MLTLLKPLPQRWLVAGLTAFLILVAAIGRPEIVSADNFAQVLRQISVIGLMAVGVIFVTITGRLDLSVGSLLSLTVVMGIKLHDIAGPGVSVALIAFIGIAVGCVNGLLVAWLRLNSLITTLGMMSILQGLTYVLSNGKLPLIVHPDDTWFAIFGRGYLGVVPIPVAIWLAIAAIAAVVLGTTTFGRRLYAVGGNELASVYSSVRTCWVVFGAYLISAVATSIAGLVLASRVMAGQNNTGAGYEVTVLSAIVLGGAGLAGGSGQIMNAVVGVIIIGFINNILILYGLPYYTQWLIFWAVIVLTLWIGAASARGRVFA